MTLLSKFKNHIGKLIRCLINQLSKQDARLLTFIPHGGSEIDGYNIFNYKSDSALTFFHYVLVTYGNKYKYQIATGENEKASLSELAKKFYPGVEIKMISHPIGGKNQLSICKAISKSVYIFTSQAISFDYVTSKQSVNFLGYYSGNFKNDFVEKHKHNPQLFNNYACFFSLSNLFTQINALLYNVDINKFKITGLVRNDNLYLPYDCPSLDSWIQKGVDYEVEKVFLYTPTHRDYEEHHNKKRSILGFDFDKDIIESFLKIHKCVIIVKLHSHQNINTLAKEVPTGVLLHKASKEYGLTEMMQRADFLISDYSSTYFDYLLLDRPVLFNFYDLDIYEETRGLTFDPLNGIIAGEIFTDQNTMLKKMELVMSKDEFQSHRHIIRDIFFKYKDSKASERVFENVFND